MPLTNRFNVLDSGEASDTNARQSVATSNTQKIAPIVVTDVKANIQKIIDDLGIDCDIKIVSIGEKKFPRSIEDKNKIVDELKSKQINFFSHHEHDSKIFKVILSGLPQIEITTIEKDLKELKKITMFTTQSRNKLYLCHFDKSAVNMKTLNTIKVIYHHIVKWLPYKPKTNSPTQCYRCCIYGHGARSCNRFAVCMLCSGNHTAKECTQITTKTENPMYKCFNCASAGNTKFRKRKQETKANKNRRRPLVRLTQTTIARNIVTFVSRNRHQ